MVQFGIKIGKFGTLPIVGSIHQHDMNRIPTEWLLGCDPWTSYRTRLDLLDGFPEDPAVIADRQAMVRHPKIREMMAKLTGWPGPVVSGHKNGNAFFHLLPWLAELGINKNDEPMYQVIKRILELASEEGPFGVTMNIPVHYGGTGTDVSTWAICDAPRTVYGLALMGLKDHPALLKASDYLMGLVRENGYPCVVSKELGKFRGPGRKDDPCPYATLIMLELMSGMMSLKNPLRPDNPPKHCSIYGITVKPGTPPSRAGRAFHAGIRMETLDRLGFWSKEGTIGVANLSCLEDSEDGERMMPRFVKTIFLSFESNYLPD